MASLPLGETTLLALSGVGVPPYSARGLKQSLEPIGMSQQTRRTVNGKLVNLAPLQFQKYRSKITGTDQDPPAFDGTFPGKLVTVDCVAEIACPPGSSPNRPTVASRTDDAGWTYYRPQLDMMVTGTSMDASEWDAETGWSIDLEEV